MESLGNASMYTYEYNLPRMRKAPKLQLQRRVTGLHCMQADEWFPHMSRWTVILEGIESTVHLGHKTLRRSSQGQTDDTH